MHISIMLVFWSLVFGVRNSVVLAVYLLFSVVCFFTVHEHSAAAILSECGLSPFDVENIVMVIRAFPIRVSGESGDLPNEIDWTILRDELGKTEDIAEYTSCTNRIRRVARFDAEVVTRSIISNQPNVIVLNHLDYVDDLVHNLPTVSNKCKEFISMVEAQIGQKISYFGTGVNTLFSRQEIR